MDTPLKEVPLFQNLAAKEFRVLDESTQEKAVKKNTVIFNQNDPTEHLYILLGGQVKLFNARQGTQKEEIVCLIEPREFFCLAPMLTKPSYHISAKSTKNSQLILIPKKTVQNLIRSSHTFAQNVIQYIACKECSTCERNCDLSLSTTKERLAKYLMSQYSNQGNHRSLKLTMSQAQLASHLGTVRETLSRDMTSLKKAGILASKSGKIVIADAKQLSKIAGATNN